jgi:hypothetical protein
MSKCQVCETIKFARKTRRQRKWCDLCHENKATYIFEHLGSAMALWFCPDCYDKLTNEHQLTGSASG